MTGSNLQRNEVNAGTPANWYVVETNARQERTANFQLRRLGFQPYLPMRQIDKKAAGLAAPLFPSYLFVREHPTLSWHDVCTAPGVRSALLAAGKPARTPRGLVDAIRAKEVYGLVQLHKPSAPASAVPFVRGDRLRIVAGNLRGFDGLFEEMADRNRVWMLLSLFGRVARVDISLDAVEKGA